MLVCTPVQHGDFLVMCIELSDKMWLVPGVAPETLEFCLEKTIFGPSSLLRRRLRPFNVALGALSHHECTRQLYN
jgi:hypothetical protein